MPSIVIELQRDSLNPAVAVSDLLRKALFTATKLNIPEFTTWIEYELAGYRDCDDESLLPPYRIVFGTLMAQDRWNRWAPARFRTAEETKMISKVAIFDSIAEIETLLHRFNRDRESNIRIDCSPEQVKLLRDMFSEHRLVMFTRYIRVEDLKRVIDAVKTEILRWSMKLEKDGIVGEGSTFTAEEQRKASTIQYNTHFHGPVGNVAQNAEHFNQTANIEIQADDLKRLVTQFSEHLNELQLDARQQERAEKQLAILRTELAGEPDLSIVRQAAHSLRNITEGAIGSLLTQPGVWHWIHQFLASF